MGRKLHGFLPIFLSLYEPFLFFFSQYGILEMSIYYIGNVNVLYWARQFSTSAKASRKDEKAPSQPKPERGS